MVIWNSWNGLTKGKPGLTDLTAFCDKISRFVDEGRAKDVAYMDFNKAFSSVSCNILVSKLGHHNVVVGQLGGLITDWMVGLKV